MLYQNHHKAISDISNKNDL